jgi:long-chain acyl-CoA synthetase
MPHAADTVAATAEQVPEIPAELTIPKLFLQKARHYGSGRVAMREKEFGIWRPITWQEYLDNVKYIRSD